MTPTEPTSWLTFVDMDNALQNQMFKVSESSITPIHTSKHRRITRSVIEQIPFIDNEELSDIGKATSYFKLHVTLDNVMHFYVNCLLIW